MNTDSDMTLSVRSAINSTVATLTVRYLIVESNFTFLQIEHFTSSFPGTAYNNSWTALAKVVTGLSSFPSDETLITVIKEYDMMDN